jgi:hypothetical protein
MKRREFVKTTGISGIAFSGILPLLSCSRNDARLEEELKEQSLLAFRRFEEVWDFSDFWKRGNTFDACLVFANAVQQKWPEDDRVKQMQQSIITMLEKNLAFFNTYDPGSLWADDFGWWGLMALNARKLLLNMGEIELAEKYWKLADDLCWEYKKNTAYDHTADALPVPNGCRNGDANGHSPGVKNTVTNVLLFLLSSRIYRAATTEERIDSDKYLDMAYRQWLWFAEWFTLDEYEYLKNLKTEGALVQERPMAFFDGSGYTEKIHPPWAEGWVWTGDQGMLVAALTDMIAIKDKLAEYLGANGLDNNFDVEAFEIEVKELTQRIGKGVENALVANVDGLIREAPCFSSFGPEHGRDYLAGRGIMMRYLGSNQEKSRLGVNLNQAVLKTTQAIWNTRDKTNNQFQPEYTSEKNDQAYVEQFRALWGLADNVHKWDIETMVEKNKNAVCQSVGLDMLGAAIKALP